MSFFFFRQKTAYEMRISDWSSDVCSSDLVQYQCPSDASRKDVEPDRNGRDYRNEGNGDGPTLVGLQLITRAGVEHEMAQARTKMLNNSPGKANHYTVVGDGGRAAIAMRSEERREGKEGCSECRSR